MFEIGIILSLVYIKLYSFLCSKRGATSTVFDKKINGDLRAWISGTAAAAMIVFSPIFWGALIVPAVDAVILFLLKPTLDNLARNIVRPAILGVRALLPWHLIHN